MVTRWQDYIGRSTAKKQFLRQVSSRSKVMNACTFTARSSSSCRCTSMISRWQARHQTSLRCGRHWGKRSFWIPLFLSKAMCIWGHPKKICNRSLTRGKGSSTTREDKRSQRMLKQPLQLNLMGKMRTKDVPFLLPWSLRSLILPTIWALSRGREKEASCKKRKSKDINIP